jgi:GNAT superfamily N-acetyltransferase
MSLATEAERIMATVLSEVRAPGATASLVLRTAQPADMRDIEAMQRVSMRTLGLGLYSDLQIESFLRHMQTLEPALIADGRYYVGSLDGEIVACGGWSTRAPAYYAAGVASVGGLLPKVRAMYVHPRAARRGFGRRMLDEIEAAVLAAGFAEATLDATLPGVPLYLRCGYRAVAETQMQFPDGVCLPVICMHKRLGAGADRGMRS